MAGADFDERMRILMLGDSFTFGMTADIGKSYVETIEANFPQSVVWNTGIQGTGTQQALLLFQTYAPILQPQITVLGLYRNDFEDNIMPLDRWVQWEDGRIIQRYLVNDRGNMRRLERHEVSLYLPPASEIQRFIASTRLGSLALKAGETVRRWGGEEERVASPELPLERMIDATREYLMALRDSAVEQDMALLVLLIPHRNDIDVPSSRHQTAIQLMEELGLPYLNPLHALDVNDYAPKPDIHWNSAGHQKIGAVLSDCIEAFQVRQDLSDCEEVEMP